MGQGRPSGSGIHDEDAHDLQRLESRVALDDYRGRWLVLFFYPLDFTFVCPTEILALSDRYNEFAGLGTDVLGVSTDSVHAHRAWIQTPREQNGIAGLRYPLASDITKAVSADYGVLVEDEGVALRGLFIIDPAVEAPTALAPLIDPNVHSCGTVPPHGADELAHPEPNFYMIGMKSYGRAPTFLLLTGYKQARSVVAALAGDWEAARRVELTLPETGVCSGPVAAGGGVASSCCGATLAAPVSGTNLIALTPVGANVAASARNIDLLLADSDAQAAATGCCGGPAPAGADACCVKDADAKAAGQDGCGCGTAEATSSEPVVAAGACCG